MRQKQDSLGSGYATPTASPERSSGRSASTPKNGVRNLDDIQEHEPHGPHTSRVSALVMASFGGACIVFGALFMMRSPEQEKPEAQDPLGALVSATKGDEAPGREKLAHGDVTFPSVLTDRSDPTTAMEVVRGDRERASEADSGELPRAPMVYDGPPPAGDRLPVVPLPAQDMLTAPGKVPSSDILRGMASEVAKEDTSVSEAEAGGPGGYQLQVSSFKDKPDADAFAAVLRRRGHKAHVEEAHVKGRGLWHRVRIGPFKYKRSAEIYRQDFEAKERMVTFVVDPPKTQIFIAPASGEP